MIQDCVLPLRTFDQSSRETRTPIFEVQIMKKCHSAYNPQSLKVKLNIQFAA